MEAQSNDSVGALTDTFANDIVVQVVNRGAIRAELAILWRGGTFHLIDLGFVQRMALFFGCISLLLALVNLSLS